MDALKRDEKGRLVKGTPPGPGRPKGSISLITRLKQRLEEDPRAAEAFLDRYFTNPNNEKHVVEMVDGKPNQKIEAEVTFPKPILGGISEDELQPNDSD
jgi:hypothetical protein